MMLILLLVLVLGNAYGGNFWIKQESRQGYSVGFIQRKVGGFECKQVACADKLLVNR